MTRHAFVSPYIFRLPSGLLIQRGRNFVEGREDIASLRVLAKQGQVTDEGPEGVSVDPPPSLPAEGGSQAADGATNEATLAEVEAFVETLRATDEALTEREGKHLPSGPDVEPEWGYRTKREILQWLSAAGTPGSPRATQAALAKHAHEAWLSGARPPIGATYTPGDED